MRLIYAGGHCHAPSCLGIWLYRNDPGHEMELLCHQRTVYGKGNVSHDKYDETVRRSAIMSVFVTVIVGGETCLFDVFAMLNVLYDG